MIPQEPPRAVFDCVVFLQGAARPTGPAGQCFQLVEKGAVRLCLTSAVIAEIREVLTRPSVQRRFPILTTEYVTKFLEIAARNAYFMDDVPSVFKYARDPDDVPYINLAIAAGARYLVSRDNDLLDLMKEDRPEGKAFRQAFRNLLILNPVSLLREFASKSDKNVFPGGGET